LRREAVSRNGRLGFGPFLDYSVPPSPDARAGGERAGTTWLPCAGKIGGWVCLYLDRHADAASSQLVSRVRGWRNGRDGGRRLSESEAGRA